MKDIYEKFAYDDDEFGDIKDYLGPEQEFWNLYTKDSRRLIVLAN